VPSISDVAGGIAAPFGEALFAVALVFCVLAPEVEVVAPASSAPPPPQALKITLPPNAPSATINCRRFNIMSYSTIEKVPE
jgi:hypothetical protein